MSTKCLIASLVLLLVHTSSGQRCNKLSFQRLCVTDGNDLVLENERLSMTINKTKGQIIELYYNSIIDTTIKSTNLVGGGSNYYLANIDVDGKNASVRPYMGNINITQNAELIDIAFISNDTSIWPVYFEFHLVLEKNSSVFYYYSIHKYLRDGYTAGQLRWAIRANMDIFKYYSVDGKRAGTMPLQRDIKSAQTQTVQDWTYMFKDGTVYSKYQQISSNEDINTVFGIYGNRFGLSLLQTHKEWVSGGPFKQDLTTHTGHLLLFHEHSGHYGTPELVPTKGWTKVYGPIGLYFNEGLSLSEMYSDAQRQLREEEKKWPYQFVTAPEYNAQGRGSVSGVLTVDGSPNKEWTYLILTEPHVDDPQFESATYMYSAVAGKNGEFKIPAVRPGTYKLQVIAKGVVGRYIQDNIHVYQKENSDLGTIDWKQETHGELLWQIGVPDRSSAEFKSPPGFPSPIPNLEEYRKFGTWLSYPKTFPNDPDFTVGLSDPAEDWCYFMPTIKTPGFPAQLKLVNVTQNAQPTIWKVRFNYSGSTKGNATLILGFTARVKAGIRALINGEEILEVVDFDGPQGDSALFRQAAHGIFHQQSVTFGLSLLKDKNILELTPAGVVNQNHFDRMMMWDFLRMEVSN
ncbi:uncharacterized protein LOC108734573 [Agrilus planipennis]|uniref:rhamnogalacturonan endolyase n=1 Tax=Agrilus planipennis TaxID=224129 RepID=A0A1W4WNT2_AGRPL|nr:uncharacterized protein LOC108734573 [Agrilus planipennis]